MTPRFSKSSKKSSRAKRLCSTNSEKLLTDRPRRDDEVRRFQGLLRQLDDEPDVVVSSENAANPEDSGPPQGIVNEDVNPRSRFLQFADKVRKLFPMPDEGGSAVLVARSPRLGTRSGP